MTMLMMIASHLSFPNEADKHPLTILLITMRKELDVQILLIWVFGK